MQNLHLKHSQDYKVYSTFLLGIFSNTSSRSKLNVRLAILGSHCFIFFWTGGCFHACQFHYLFYNVTPLLTQNPGLWVMFVLHMIRQSKKHNFTICLGAIDLKNVYCMMFNENCTLSRSLGIFLPLLACTGQGHALARSVRSSAFSTSPVQ